MATELAYIEVIRIDEYAEQKFYFDQHIEQNIMVDGYVDQQIKIEDSQSE